MSSGVAATPHEIAKLIAGDAVPAPTVFEGRTLAELESIHRELAELRASIDKRFTEVASLVTRIDDTGCSYGRLTRERLSNTIKTASVVAVVVTTAVSWLIDLIKSHKF